MLRGSQGVGKFTATKLDNLPAGRYKDPAQEGLYLLVRDRAKGTASRTWVHRIKHQGRDTYLPVGRLPSTLLAEARTKVQEQREQIAKGIDPLAAAPRRRRRPTALPSSAPSASDRHSIEFLVHEFMTGHIEANHRQPGYTQAILNRDVLTTWRGRDARTIKSREVIELLDRIVARGSKIMANRTASTIDQMFTYGIHRAIVEESPVRLLYRPGGKERSRERCLTDAELSALLKNPKDATRFERLAHVIVLLLLTAVRRSELALARWVDIDFNEKTWRIPDEHSKTGKGFTVPLSDWAIREFEALQRLARHNRYVLPSDDGHSAADPKLLTRGVARCLPRMKKLGIEQFTLHDLRRTCRTGLSRLKKEDGSPAVLPHVAERCLNHAPEKIAGTYDRYEYLDEKRDALNRWATHVSTLASARAP